MGTKAMSVTAEASSLSRGFHIHIWALAVEPVGISGGDKIFIECARVWARRGNKVSIYTNESGRKICEEHHLEGVHLRVIRSLRFWKWGLAIHYFVRTLQSCWAAWQLDLPSDERHVIYSASDFWPDTLPALILRKRHPQETRWVAGCYFLAPSPVAGASEAAYRGGKQPVSVRSILYFVMQQMILPLIRRWADFWVVANQLDREILAKKGIEFSRSMAIYGGVDLDAISAVQSTQAGSFDACFVGRFHVQKGAQFLVSIWKRVVAKMRGARLGIIGDGPLCQAIEVEIAREGLGKSIELLGYVDGEAKYAILKASRVFLHTPLWDTGGMAAAEGMACGLPVVAFDLPGYQHCFPQGMLKAPRENLDQFASLTLALLQDKSLHSRVQREALQLAESWDWSKRADMIGRVFPTLFSGQ